MKRFLKQFFIISIISLFLCCPLYAATYYMRADGTAANKAAAENGDPSDASTCMSIAVHNGETFAPGDLIPMGDQGGSYTVKLTPPSDGASGNPITYRAAPGESPVIDMTGQGDQCITCYNRSHLSFSGIRVTGADSTKYGFILGQAHHVTIDNCTIDTNYRGIGWTTNNTDVYDITISNCTIHTNDEYGIWWNTGDNDSGETGKSYNITITGNIIRDNTINGIRANSINLAGGADHYTSALSVQNNLVYGNNRTGISFADIDNDQGASTISDNVFYNNGDNPGANNENGLWLGNCEYVTVENNTLYNNNTGDLDGVGIFLDTRGAGYESNNCIVRYNLCYSHDSCNDQVPWHASDSAFNSSGIGLCCGAHDNDVYYNVCHSNAVGISLGCASGVTTKDNIIYNNTLVNNRLGIQIDLQNTGATGNDIQNNIIAHNTMGVLTNYGMYIDATTVVTSGNITIDYNTWYDNDTDFSDNSGQSWSQGSHKVETDPKLKDYANNKFPLQYISPCLRAGTDLFSGTATIQDFTGYRITDGSGRVLRNKDGIDISIGAYQYYPKHRQFPCLMKSVAHGLTLYEER